MSQEERQRIIDLRRFERKKRHARRPELLSVVKCVWGGLISRKVFLKLFYKSQFPHKFVNLSFTITNMKNELTDLWGN